MLTWPKAGIKRHLFKQTGDMALFELIVCARRVLDG